MCLLISLRLLNSKTCSNFTAGISNSPVVIFCRMRDKGKQKAPPPTQARPGLSRKKQPRQQMENPAKPTNQVNTYFVYMVVYDLGSFSQNILWWNFAAEVLIYDKIEKTSIWSLRDWFNAWKYVAPDSLKMANSCVSVKLWRQPSEFVVFCYFNLEAIKVALLKIWVSDNMKISAWLNGCFVSLAPLFCLFETDL